MGEMPRGTLLGRYAICDEIASGGMATVHVGTLLGEGGFSRTVAIKRLHAQFAKDPAFVTGFLDEAKVASRIRHPNVVTTLDVVATQGELFLVMEYVHGASLARLFKLAEHERMPLPVLSAIMAAALSGLHAAHDAISENGEQMHIVHRDVSPQNVLVGADGVARVLDFGVAKAANKLQQTRDGHLKGKVSYMAPEQITQNDVDRRADVYAVAACLWEGVTGRRLFEGQNEWQLANRVSSGQVERPSAHGAAIAPELEALIMSGLALNPADRPATAHAFATELERLVPPATTRAVGAWVQSVAGDELRARADYLASIERSAASSGGAAGQSTSDSILAAIESPTTGSGPRPAPSGSSPSYRDATSGSNSAFGSTSTSTLASPAHLAGDGPSDESRSRKLNFALSRGPEKGGVSRTALIFGILVLLLSGIGIGLVVSFSRGGVPAPMASAQPAAQPVVVSPPAAPPVIVPVVIGAPAESAATATASAHAAAAPVAPPRPAPAIRPVARTAPAHTAPPPAAASVAAPAAPAKNCSPPYFIDERGLKKVKPECL